MNSGLVFEGQGHSRHLHSRVLRHLSLQRSRLWPTYCSWFVTAQKNLHRPVLVDLWANTETLRSCEPASPASRRSAPRAALWRRPVGSSASRSYSPHIPCVCLPRFGSSWNPGICRRPFKIRSSRPYERKEKEKMKNDNEKKPSSQSSVTLTDRSLAIGA